MLAYDQYAIKYLWLIIKQWIFILSICFYSQLNACCQKTCIRKRKMLNEQVKERERDCDSEWDRIEKKKKTDAQVYVVDNTHTWWVTKVNFVSCVEQ